MSRARRGLGLRLGVARGLHEQPRLAAGKVRDGLRAPASAEHLHQPGVHALDRDRLMRQQPGRRLRGFGHAGVAEHRQRHRLRRRDQPDGRAGDHAEGALAADQELGEVRAVLRQQVLQGVAGHLPGEPAELGADQAEVRPDQGIQRGTGHGGGGQAVPVQAPGREPLPRGGQHVQAHHVVGGAAVSQGPRAAGVVADRAADGRPRVRGGVRAEPEPVTGRGRGDVVQDRAGLDDRGARLRVHREDPVHVPGEVQHDAGADGVARDGGAAAAAGERHPGPPGDVQRGGRLVGVPREGHHARQDAVVRRVGGVLGPAPGRVVHLGQPGTAQLGGQVAGRHGRGRGAFGACDGHGPGCYLPAAASGRTAGRLDARSRARRPVPEPGGRQRDPDVHAVRRAPDGGLRPVAGDHGEHPPVAGQDVHGQRRHAPRLGPVDQRAHQRRAYAPALPGVGHHHADIGRPRRPPAGRPGLPGAGPGAPRAGPRPWRARR